MQHSKITYCLILLGTTLLSPVIRAETMICVEVNAKPEQQENLHKLVIDELGHHPSHVVVDQGCDSKLSIELFELQGIQYLTARINQEVPIRFTLKTADELNEKITEAVSQALSHDPVYLADDITHYSAIQRAAHSVLKRGNNIWRLELYQGLAPGGTQLAFAPGGAVSMTRGADHWQVYARVYFGGWPVEAVGDEMALRVQTGGDIGLTYEFSALSNLTFYVSAGIGLQYLRYDGRVASENAANIDHRNDFGPTFHSRIGIRFLRLYDFDCDLFAIGYLPLFPADKDTQLDDFYSPSVQLGFGVGF